MVLIYNDGEQMNQTGHLQAAQELQATRSRLLVPDDIRTYVEVTLGIAQHYISYGLDRRYGSHPGHPAVITRAIRRIAAIKTPTRFILSPDSDPMSVTKVPGTYRGAGHPDPMGCTHPMGCTRWGLPA